MIRYRLLDRCGNVVYDSTDMEMVTRVSKLWSACGYKTGSDFYNTNDRS